MSDHYFECGVPNLTSEEADELDRRLLAAIDAYLTEIGKPTLGEALDTHRAKLGMPPLDNDGSPEAPNA